VAQFDPPKVVYYARFLHLGIGLEYVDAVYRTIMDSDFAQYTITGMKALAVLFFLVNILKK
jgi:class 3 adenylate cyclase